MNVTIKNPAKLRRYASPKQQDRRIGECQHGTPIYSQAHTRCESCEELHLANAQKFLTSILPHCKDCSGIYNPAHSDAMFNELFCCSYCEQHFTNSAAQLPLEVVINLQNKLSTLLLNYTK